jgi:hypothetical protein
MFLVKKKWKYRILKFFGFPEKSWFRWFFNGKLAISRHIIDRLQFQDQIWKGYENPLRCSKEVNKIWEQLSGLRRLRSRQKVKNLQLGSNVRFVENQISGSLCPYMVLWEAKGLFKRVQAKNSWKKICSSFSNRNILEFNDGRPWLTNRTGANFFSVKVPHIITFFYS